MGNLWLLRVNRVKRGLLGLNEGKQGETWVTCGNVRKQGETWVTWGK